MASYRVTPIKDKYILHRRFLWFFWRKVGIVKQEKLNEFINANKIPIRKDNP